MGSRVVDGACAHLLECSSEKRTVMKSFVFNATCENLHTYRVIAVQQYNALQIHFSNPQTITGSHEQRKIICVGQFRS